jgi:ATP-binding cassette subfamily A (ABC1) protein 3
MDHFIYPLQWALNSQIAGIDDSLRPSTRLFNGAFGPNQSQYIGQSTVAGPKFWLSVVTMYLGPFFVLILIGVVYHMATFIATERESSMSELMSSQEVTIVPRVLSTMLSFSALYLPSMIFSSVIISQVLFTNTNDGVMLVLTILAGISFVTFSHFLGSFFNKANLAGLYTSTLVMALSLISVYSALKYYEPIEMLMPMGLIFPPFLWATLVRVITILATSPTNLFSDRRHCSARDEE